MGDICTVIELYRWIIASTLILTFLGAYLVYNNNRKNRLAESGKHLLESFDITIHHIEKYEGQFYLLENVLLSEFDNQRKTIREFKRHLNPIPTIRFNRACRNYYGEDDDSPNFRQYIMSKDVQQTLLKRINAITKFAKKA